MATNTQNARPAGTPGDPPVVEPTPTSTPVVTPSGVGGVAVYDRYEDERADSTRPTSTLGNERVPVETRSSGSVMGWIIGAIIVIVLAYLLFQFIF